MSKKPHDEKSNSQHAEDHSAKDKDHPAELTHLSYEEMEEKLNEAEAKANQYYDQALRTQAELENIRRRTERDVAGAHKYGQEKLVKELLAVIDALERADAGITKDQLQQNPLVKSMHEGILMTQGLLLKTLEKFGVKQLNPVGEAFNPEWHQALSAKEDPSAKPNTVVEVLQKGYLLQDRLLRPALVMVTKS